MVGLVGACAGEEAQPLARGSEVVAPLRVRRVRELRAAGRGGRQAKACLGQGLAQRHAGKGVIAPALQDSGHGAAQFCAHLAGALEGVAAPERCKGDLLD